MTLHPGQPGVHEYCQAAGGRQRQPPPLEHQLYDAGPGTPYLTEVGIFGVLTDLAQGRKHKLPVTTNRVVIICFCRLCEEIRSLSVFPFRTVSWEAF